MYSVSNFTDDIDYGTEYCPDEETNNITNATSGSNALSNPVTVTLYAVICGSGLVGNGLVIYVILRYAKMKTVTNMYILNLAVSDAMFLISLPLLAATTWLGYWAFGKIMCKLFFILISINSFTGVFTLTALSADRYLAVCHAIASQRYRTPKMALVIILGIWSISFLVMLPIILYSTTFRPRSRGHYTCTVIWPEGQLIPQDKAYTWYAFLLGFAIPVSLISVFYVLVILKLRTVGPKGNRSRERRKSHRKVTKMVLAVISVYIVCWLPHWVFQVHLTLKTKMDQQVQAWKILLYQVLTLLSYTNSMLNPILYAFLSDNFRKSFMKAFRCASINDANRSLCAENSMHGNVKKHHKDNDNHNKQFIELKTAVEQTLNSEIPSHIDHHNENGNYTKESFTEGENCTTKYVDKEIQTKGNQ